MIQAKCIDKFRDANNKIIGYRLIDLNGQTQDVKSENLKRAIENKQINIVNLTLTSDYRLVDTNEKQLKLKSLGTVPKVAESASNKKYVEVAKAMVALEKCMLGMGDSYREIIENTACTIMKRDLKLYDLDDYYSNSKYSDCKDDDEILDRVFLNIYTELAMKKPQAIADTINYWHDNDFVDNLSDIVMYENNKKASDSKVIKDMMVVYTFFKDNKEKNKTINNMKDMIRTLKEIAVPAIKIGNEVGNRYILYLDSKLFGTLSNSCGAVGHNITASDLASHKEYKGYSYVLHKDINIVNAPRVSMGCLFKTLDNGDVGVDIKLARMGYVSEHCVNIVGYIKDITSIQLSKNDSADKNAKKLADVLTLIAPKIIKLADNNPNFKKFLPIGGKLEHLFNN